MNKYIDNEIIEFLKPYSAAKSMQDWEISEIYRLAKEVNGDILEIGAYRGRSTIALAKGVENGGGGQVHTIEPFIAHGEIEQNKQTCLNYWKSAGVTEGITLHQDLSQNVNFNQEFALLLIDGDHSYEGVKHDFIKFSPLVKESGYIVLHDFHLKGVKQMFDELIYPNFPNGYVEFRVIGSLIVIKKLSWGRVREI